MALKVHHLRPAPGARTEAKRVGRGEGGKGGKTAGRGTKGSGVARTCPRASEGGQMPLHMRTPKMRGFQNPFRVSYQVVNLAKLAEVFPKGGRSASRTWWPTVWSVPTSLSRCWAPVVGQVRRHRRRVLGFGEGEDRGCGRFGHRALKHRVNRPAGGRSFRVARFRFVPDAQSGHVGQRVTWR